MISRSCVIEETNLSRAWATAFLAVVERGTVELAPLVVTVTGFTNNQTPEMDGIRRALDAALVQANEASCETVAKTIFPHTLWNPDHGRDQFFDRYRRILPRLKRIDPKNRYGLYFERMIDFHSYNQLDRIIRTYQGGNHRRSALQISTFDPCKDLANQPMRGFPCLQQVAFAPSRDGGLALTAFYAVQYLFEKAYGNYLCLCRLGHFVAHELGLRLTRMTCVAGVAQRGDLSKREVQSFVHQLQAVLDNE